MICVCVVILTSACVSVQALINFTSHSFYLCKYFYGFSNYTKWEIFAIPTIVQANWTKT